MKIAFAMIHVIVNAFKPEGCFHPSKVMQFRTSIKTEFGINLNQLSYDQSRKAIRNNYVCNDTLCIFCGNNFVHAHGFLNPLFKPIKITENLLYFRSIQRNVSSEPA